MFVFEASDTGSFALVNVATKAQLPFDEYVVVAGQVQCSRQLTGVGGRVKRDGKRRLLVMPLPQDTETLGRVQVLDAGELAVSLLQGAQACFPTLVRTNPMADDDSDLEEAEEAHKKQKLEAEIVDEETAQQITARALEYMGQTQVTVLTTLDELFSAFQIADPAHVQWSLQNDPSMPKHYQLMCMDCPPFGTANDGDRVAAPHAFSSSTSPEPFNVGILFSTRQVRECFLQIPVPRSPRVPATGVQREGYVQESFQDATVLTFGAKREETVHGGGKTCDEMIKNIRMRHASGTFCKLVLPTKTWEQVVDAHKALLPQVCELQGELRLRRLLGTAICEAPVELLLER